MRIAHVAEYKRKRSHCMYVRVLRMTGLWSRTALLVASCILCAAADTGQSPREDVLLDPRIPLHCNSPGWIETPRDVSVAPGNYVFMRCRSALPSRMTFWVVNGRDDIMSSSFSNRAVLYNRNSSLKFGPLEAGDGEILIGCRVWTAEYGLLPSPLATISTLLIPRYSARKFRVAVVGQPLELDMGYLSAHPPRSVMWLKDGMVYHGDGDRVHTDHTGITFSTVLSKDSGRYIVIARNAAGIGQAFTVLKVLTWPTNTSNPSTWSPHLALMVALTQRHNHIIPHPIEGERLGVMAIIRRLLYRATPEATQQGSARLQLEELLEQVLAMLGSRNDVTIPPSDLEVLNEATNCTVPKYDCTKFSVLKYRTYDGTCNNLFFPLNGAAVTPFPRLLPAEYEDGISSPMGYRQTISGDEYSPPWPSPRLISWKIVRNSSDSESDHGSGLTHMVMQWGQFLDHDLDLAPVFDVECGCLHSKECMPISVSTHDSTFGNQSSNSGKCLSFSRSIPACHLESTDSLPRGQINQITSFIDASQVYGSSHELALSLRLRRGGLLKQGGRAESDKGNLPFQKERPEGGILPFFIAGDERANEQTGLTVMHTLWLREHNRIARALRRINRCWDDEKLYQEARKIVAAQMQKITFYDFLPTIFGRHQNSYIPRYKGYNPFVDASIPNSFAAAAYRFGHSLIRHQLLRLDENYTTLDIGHLDLSRAFFNPVSYFESQGTDAITRGLMVDVANPVDEFLNSVLTSKLFSKTPDQLGGDLASLNIQRGRDHGLPSYRTWERFCKRLFPRHTATFEDDDTEALMRHLYGETTGFQDGIDLWVGGLAEARLEGAQVGPTLACIMGLSFTRLRDGDRFWFELENQFSAVQRRTLKESSLAQIVCQNGDNIKRVSKNVFLSDSEHVACEELPVLDLWRWVDYSCYRHYS